MAARPFHVVVWGANGFTGRLVCEHIAKAYPGKIKWAMAGRNKEKLEATRVEISKYSPEMANVPILLADLNNKESLDKLATSTNVVICLAGPYTLYGTPVVQACVDAGTHYCDLTGESNFVQDTIATFHESAKTKKCKIVHACGFDSIPSEITALVLVDYLKQKHNVATDYVEFVLRDTRGGVSGGTIESLLTVLKQKPEKLKNAYHPYAFVPEKCGKPVKDLPDKGVSPAPKFLKLSNTWSAPFVMAPFNEPIVRRSSDLLGYGPTFKYSERMGAGSLPMALLGSFGFLVLVALMKLLSLSPFLRKKLPLPGSGPSREAMENGFCIVSGVGVGASVNAQEAPKAYSIYKMYIDPGYFGTARMILETALCLALQSEEVAADRFAGKVQGGVVTPAVACGLVLVERLKNAGVDIGVSDRQDAFSFAKKKIE